jgi:hypothetical protein
MAEALRDDKFLNINFERVRSDELALVWRPWRVLKPTRSLGVIWYLRSRAQDGRLPTGWNRRRNRRDWVSTFFSPYAREVRAEALNGDSDSGFLFEPLANARKALPIGNGSSDLRPKGAQLASFCGWLFPTTLCEAVSRLGDPLLLRFCVFLASRHRINSLHGPSTYFNGFRQPNGPFNTFRRISTSPQATNMGSGT